MHTNYAYQLHNMADFEMKMKRRAHDLVSGKGIQLDTSYMLFN